MLFFEKGKPTKEIWYWEHKLPEGVKSYSKTKLIKKNEFEGLKDWWNNRKENERAWRVSINAVTKNGYNLDSKNPSLTEEKQAYSSIELANKLQESFRKSEELLQKLKSEVKDF
jgi:type I restriction enzyme M protein